MEMEYFYRVETEFLYRLLFGIPSYLSVLKADRIKITNYKLIIK